MKKKILYLTRFFNGLHNSFIDGFWKPDGVPTIYKMIEGLDKSEYKVEFIFSNFNLSPSQKFNKFYTKHKLDSFESDFHILSIYSRGVFRKIHNLIFFIHKLFFLVKFIKRFSPDLIYIDRAHVIEGAVIKKIFKSKVFLRVMGVAVYSYNDILKGNSFFSTISRWSFRTRFDHILFSQDGGNIENFKKKYIKKSVRTTTLFNGVKNDKVKLKIFEKIKKKYSDKIKILFVSRLEKNKKCDVFLQSIFNLDQNTKNKIAIFIAGTGSEIENLKKLVNINRSKRIINFLGPLEHNKINYIYDISDIFVSLNTTGNFSNNCLEAFHSGICCIIPEENKINGCDKIIKKYINKNSIIRITHKDMCKDLTNTIYDLVNNKKKIKTYAKSVKRDSRRFLKSWNVRINQEISLIKNIISQ